jgi:alpha-tubulin suppressor-like RCC1 family protein
MDNSEKSTVDVLLSVGMLGHCRPTHRGRRLGLAGRCLATNHELLHLGIGVVLLAASGCSSPSPEARDSVATSREALSQVSSANLQLKVLTNSCGLNQVQDFFQVVNSGTTSVTLSDLKIRLWLHETSTASVVPSINTGGCVINANGCFHSVTGATASALAFAPACGPDPGHQANREITISTTDHSLLGPGQTWTNLQSVLRLSNYANFTPGTNTWYSRCLSGTSYASDAHFALYYKGNLVFASGLTPPTCRAPQGKQKLQGYVTAEMASARLVGPLSPSTVVRFGVGLPLQHQQDLQTFVTQVSDPSSPLYRAYLTQDLFTATYAPTQDTYNSIVTWANANGLTVDNPSSPSRMFVDIQGTAANVEKALFSNFVQRLRSDGSTFYMLDREPSLELDTPVLRISGLDDFQKNQVAVTMGTGPSGTSYVSDFRDFYTACTSRDGATQRIGIFARDGFHPSDISAYAAADGLTKVPPVAPILLGGFDGTPRNIGSQEVELDIEMAIGMAPGIEEIQVFEVDPNVPAEKANNDILDAMTSQPNLANQLSSSFWFTHDDNTQQFMNKIVAQGQSFFQSSGDNGSYPPNTQTTYPNVLWGLTLVGETSLYAPGQTYQGTLLTAPLEVAAPGSGGGVLGNIPIPDYQVGLDMSLNGGSTTHRNVPDVAMNGFQVAGIQDDEIPYGNTGTSVSAPLWAGFMALINQENFRNGNPPVGFFNPVVYAIGRTPGLYGGTFNDLHDGVSTGTFSSVTGYDLVTGWGSPKCELIAQLGSAKPLIPTRVGLAPGHLNMCAVLADGSAKCWGNNDFGQLGDGTTTTRTTPVSVAGISQAVSLSAGPFHTCAVLPTGTVKCWGYNAYGVLGDGTTTNSLTPVQVSGLTDATAVSAGYEHTCALRSNGTVMCWGNGTSGGLGDGTFAQMRTTPVAVTGLTGVLAVRSGTDYTCGLVSPGSVQCWGENSVGELGDGTTTSRATPAPVSGLSGVLDISTSDTYACALLSSKTIKCWGFSTDGQLGDNVHSEVATAPVDVKYASGVLAISAGSDHACFTMNTSVPNTDNMAGCWGRNNFGQIGDGTTVEQDTIYFPINGIPSPVAVAAGTDVSCALSSSGDVYCWGVNQYGTLGNGTTTSSLVPVKVQF